MKRLLRRSGIALAASSIALMAATPGAVAQPAETIHELTAQANAEARRLRLDARLVQIEVMTFGLVTGPTGLPDRSRVGPPTALLFHYLSPAARTEVRVIVRAGLPGARPLMQADELAHPATPYTVPIPDAFMELDAALARAQQGGFQRECAGVNPNYGCGRVVRAELHAHVAAGGTRTPVWTFDFGQDAAAGKISRQVDAITGRVVAREDPQDREARRDGDTPFSAVAVGVQLSERWGAPAVTTVKSGEDFWIAVEARLVTQVKGLRICVVIVVRSSATEADRWCKDAGAALDARGLVLQYTTGMQFSLSPSRDADVLDITGILGGNGVTREAHTSVRVSR